MSKQEPIDRTLVQAIWQQLGGAPAACEAITFAGPQHTLPSVYEVSALASASVAASLLALAELDALRKQRPLRAIKVERAHAAAAFRSERYLAAQGWQLPPVWDPIAGDYPTADGFIRLHTNYAHHRDAVTRVLGVAAEREAVAAALAHQDSDALESAVVAANGCAAALRSPAAWAESAPGRAIAQEPLFALATRPTPGVRITDLPPGSEAGPLRGVRVLDLTRVIAGPVCTRVLAAYGADVLRIDPPGFEEVGALLAETTVGKRRAALNLREPHDRERFEACVAGAHVMVHGYRSDALERLGYGPARLRALNPALVSVSEDAYGWSGPWQARRGFDSLVQMSCGIAWRGREVSGSRRPFPLPAQALDHATGYLLAAATCRALVRLLAQGEASEVRLSLARTAKLLMDQGDAGDPKAPDLTPADVEPWLESADTAFGTVMRVRCPAGIAGIEPHWKRQAGPLGADAPVW